MSSPATLSDQPYLVITADSHAGAAPELYGPYLEQQWQSDYQDWLKQAEQLAKMMREVMGSRSIGVDGDPDEVGWRNWDSKKRLAECEREGVVGEVVFPNTSPPFAPSMLSEFGEADVGADHKRRWAGIRAHNRWLADFCAEAPLQRAGIAQIFLPFVEESVKEIRWAHEHGLRGGILLPGAPPGSGIEPLYAPCYEPIWATCAELGMPINHHAGGSAPEFGNYLPQSLAMYILEVQWWAYRSLWHLMFSGVFERHPELQYVLTETGLEWVSPVLAQLDGFYHRMKTNTQCSEHIFGGPTVANLSLTPSEYFQRQIWIGASFLSPAHCPLREEVGVHKIMWGSDYPHVEGSHPWTREHLRLTFHDVPENEVRAILGENAASLYGFDIHKLAALTTRVGPSPAEIATPVTAADVPIEAQKSPAFASLAP